MRNTYVDTTVGTIVGGPYSILSAPLASPTFTGTVTTAAIICTGITNSGTDQAATVTSTGALNAGTNKFIVNSSGLCTTYNGIVNVSNGLAQVVATADLTAQVAAKTTTALYTPTATGMYRISVCMKVTTTGTSMVNGPVTITYTDGTDSVAQSIIMALNNTSGAVVTTMISGSTPTTGNVNGEAVIFAKTGVAINYAIAISGTVGSGVYEAHLKCEAL